MPERPWRCSQCGTVNEPVANSCRTCGKWPSLFDLEDSALDDEEYEASGVADQVPEYTHEAPEPVTVEVEPFEPEPVERPRRRFEPPPTKPVLEEGEAGGPRWVSWVIPLAFVVYIVIQYVVSAR